MGAQTCEIACAKCVTRKTFPGDAITAVRVAKRKGWRDTDRQFAGRHTVWMLCPKEGK